MITLNYRLLLLLFNLLWHYKLLITVPLYNLLIRRILEHVDGLSLQLFIIFHSERVILFFFFDHIGGLRSNSEIRIIIIVIFESAIVLICK